MTELLASLPEELRPILERELSRIGTLERENQLLRELLRLQRIQRFGPQSEKLSDAQLELLADEPGVCSAEVAAEAAAGVPPEPKRTKPRRHPGRTPLPACLERVETIVPCTPEQCRCGHCGAEKTIVSYEESEQLDMEPAKYFVRVVKREKRACACCGEDGVVAAPVPPRIVEKGKLSDRLVVDVVVRKYCEHQPLYRQCATLERDADIDLSRATLSGCVMAVGGLLVPIVGALRRDLLSGGYIQADETPVGVQSDRTKGGNHRGFLWEYGRPGGPVVFDFQMGRSREGPAAFLEGFAGKLQCDGYAAYDGTGGPDVARGGCMAHGRRKFFDCSKLCQHTDPTVNAILLDFAQLYGVEEDARKWNLDAPARLALRQSRSVPILETLKAKVLAARIAALPGGNLAKACDYMLGQWERILLFVSHGDVEVDNNICENSIRGIALGRKNWLHIGSEEAGPKVAAILSVVETCRRLRINVREYLMAILPGLGDFPVSRVAELTPMAWAAARADR